MFFCHLEFDCLFASGRKCCLRSVADNGILGEIKSGSYIYKSSQLAAFIKAAAGSGKAFRFKLFVKPGVRLSEPLKDMIRDYGGTVEIIGGSAARFIDGAFIIVVPRGALPPSAQKSIKL